MLGGCSLLGNGGGRGSGPSGALKQLWEDLAALQVPPQAGNWRSLRSHGFLSKLTFASCVFIIVPAWKCQVQPRGPASGRFTPGQQRPREADPSQVGVDTVHYPADASRSSSTAPFLVNSVSVDLI